MYLLLDFYLGPRSPGPGDLLSLIVDTTETFLSLFKRPEKSLVFRAKFFLRPKIIEDSLLEKIIQDSLTGNHSEIIQC